MSFAVLIAHHLSLSTLSIGFAVALVLSLVAAEERDLVRSVPADGEAKRN